MKSNEISIGFLTYLSRSGSTLLSRILNEYKEICVTLEASLPAELFGIKGYDVPIFNNRNELITYVDYLYKISKLDTWPIGKNDLLEEIVDMKFPVNGKELFERLLLCYKNKLKPDATTIIYKGSPIMPWVVPELRQNFQGSIIIHIFRDPRAVYASQKKNVQPYTKKVFTSSPIETAYDWKRAVKLVNISEKNTVEIKYEDLLNDKENLIRSCFKKLKIRNKKAEENTYSELIPEQERAIHKKVNQDPDQSRINGWKREIGRKEIEMLEYYLNNELIEKEYDLVTNNKTYRINLVVKKELITVFANRSWARLRRIISYLTTEPSYFFKKLKLWK